MQASFKVCPQLNREYMHRYAAHALAQLEYVIPPGIAAQLRPKIYSVAASVAGRKTTEQSLQVVPGSVLWAISNTSTTGRAFKLQLTESRVEAAFMQPVRFDGIETARLHICAEPRIVSGPLAVRLMNLSDSANDIEVVLYTAEPKDGYGPYACSLPGLRTFHARLLAEQESRRAAPLPWRDSASIDTPAPGTGRTTVLEFDAPEGQDGEIRSISWEYTNPSLVPGSGDLVASLSIDSVYAKGYDTITTQLGSAQLPYELSQPVPFMSGQTVRLAVEHAAASALPYGAGARIIGTLSGAFFPR